MTRPVRVRIVGQDRIFIGALVAWLEARAGVQVIDPASGGAADAADAANAADAADIALIDSSLRREEALAATWRLHEESPGTKPVVLGVDREDESVLDFIEAGALGYVVKGASATVLAEILEEVQAGRTRCAPAVAGAVLVRIQQLARRRERPPDPPREPLTARELEILRCLAAGLSNKEVGRRLGISVSTVKNHVHNVFGKLQVRNRREALKLAYRSKLLPALIDPLCCRK